MGSSTRQRTADHPGNKVDAARACETQLAVDGEPHVGAARAKHHGVRTNASTTVSVVVRNRDRVGGDVLEAPPAARGAYARAAPNGGGVEPLPQARGEAGVPLGDERSMMMAAVARAASSLINTRGILRRVREPSAREH